MGRAKDIIVRVIPSKIANTFVKKHHYSGKVVNNSSLHFGCFLDGKLGGVMSFGSPLDKKKVLPLVESSNKGNAAKWNEMLELNRMAFSELLPRNSESRCISVAFILIKKNAPQVKWILSFSDSTQCGDGTIYRASGFVLTKIKENKTLLKFPTGDVIAGMTIEHNWELNIIKKQCKHLGVPHKPRTRNEYIKLGANFVKGFQLRYIYLLDKTCKITVPIIPFSEIDKQGAGMYKGEKVTRESRNKPKE